MKLKLFIILAVVACSVLSMAQTVTVRDMATFLALPGAVIAGDKNLQVQTNASGVADISALVGSQMLNVDLVGYFPLTISFADAKESGVIYLTESDYYMKAVVVSASRFEEKIADVPQQIQGVSQKDMRFWSLQNTGDVLQATGNVFVQKSQMGGGSPILRGFEASRVLMVVDGVRMNNAIYRAGHLQDIITIDNNMLEKVEVVFGPGSVVYGSDALGGVMHFYTRNPEYASDDKLLIKGGAYARFSSANNENTGHFDLNIGGKRFSSLTSFTYSNFDDLRQGNVRNPFTQTYWTRPEYVERIDGIDSIVVNNNPNVQVGSAYKQYDLMQKFGFNQSAAVEHILNFQYSTSSDIPRYDRLTQYRSGKLRFAEWYYGPQDRLFAAYELRLKNANKAYDEARIILSQQMIEQSRNTRTRAKTSLESQVENVSVAALNADLMKTIKEKHELRYGFEFTYNDVKSTATAKDIETGEVSNIPTRYADGGSTMQSISAYVTHSWEVSPKVVITDGIRYSNVQLNCQFNDKTFFPFPYNAIDLNNSGLNGNLGLVYRPNEDWKVSLLGSTGYRVPNVDDMSKVFESVGATRDENGALVELGSVVVPNPDLKPERTYNVDFSIAKTFDKKVTLSGTGFYSIYQNALTASPWTFNGESIIQYAGDSANVIAMTNAAEGYLWGVNGMLTAIISDRFSFSSNLNYTYGRITLEGQEESPLDHVPPVYGKTSFNLQMKRFRGEFYVMYNGWKRLEDYRLGAEDNEANATEFGMPAWYTLNIRTATQLTKNIGLQVSLENILDINYRMFGSNISAAGRNLSVTLRANF